MSEHRTRPHPMTLLTLTSEHRADADLYGWHSAPGRMSRGVRIYGWVFHSRAMLEMRRMAAETVRLKALAASIRAER